MNRPGRDKLNWSPCHRSLSLTASCHSNKLDCCRMRPINCDVRRLAKFPVPDAIVNTSDFLVLLEHSIKMPFSILHLSWFVNAFSDRMCKHFIFTVLFPVRKESGGSSAQLCFFCTKWQCAKSEGEQHNTTTIEISHSRCDDKGYQTRGGTKSQVSLESLDSILESLDSILESSPESRQSSPESKSKSSCKSSTLRFKS